MDKADSKNHPNVLFLDDDRWFDDFSSQKYHVIHLSLNSSAQISIVDIFMLAASRLFKQGEFILRISGRASFLDINSIAIAFNFKRISSINKVVDSIAFRFEGQEIKLGYQMLQARTLTSGCVSLFKEVFGHEISNEFWHWKYPRHNEPHSVAAIKNNQVVAHYGLSDRSAVYNDTAWAASQACDVMVSPSERGAISSSVFYELVKIGERPFYRDNSDISFIYGFPHGRSYKLGARLKLYVPISPIFEVSFNITSTVSNNIDSDFLVEELVVSRASTKKKIEWVLGLMFPVHDTLLFKRDYLYILQRYVHHPEFKYKIYYFNDCCFVIKPMADRILLMDYLGALDEYATKLDLFVAYLSGVYPGSKLSLWCLEDISTSFVAPNLVRDTGAFFVNKRYSDNLPDFKKWWISMGDTEFL